MPKERQFAGVFCAPEISAVRAAFKLGFHRTLDLIVSYERWKWGRGWEGWRVGGSAVPG